MTDISPRTPCSNRSALQRVPLIGTKATADFHQGAQRSCCKSDAVYMAAAEITPASPETPLPRGSHPYTVRANRRGGIKVEGEGEWNARKHGGTKRRVWRKIHIGIDEKTLEIRAAEFTTSDIGDVEPVSATGSSEPARDATRVARPDPAGTGDRQRHSRWCLRYPQVPRRHHRPRCRRNHPAPQERQTLET